MAKTILGIGAHYDDCVFGISGTLLQAVRKNHRVIILSLIGDYTNWKPVAGREDKLVPGSIEIARQYGVEMRFLNFASMRYDVTEANKRLVAEAVAQIQPDIAFVLWPRDSHTDHEVAAELAKTALRHGDRLLPPGTRFKAPSRIYQYDNGPRHTIDFVPDTFVDITDDWRQASEWLGKLMSLVRGQPHDPASPEPAIRAKEVLSAYRGAASGVRYAEAFRSTHAYIQDIL
jgi:N-acetylglucosamine malate deacetylase 1